MGHLEALASFWGTQRGHLCFEQLPVCGTGNVTSHAHGPPEAQGRTWAAARDVQGWGWPGRHGAWLGELPKYLSVLHSCCVFFPFFNI